MRTLLLVLLGFIAFHNSAQEYVWARDYCHGFTFYSGIKSISTDTVGNVYVAGNIYGSGQIADTTATSSGYVFTSPVQNYDFFIAKVNPQSETQWIKTFGNSKDESVTMIATDENGNMFIAGENWAGGSLGQITLTYTGDFLGKINTSGTPVWAISLPSDNNNYVSISNVEVKDNAVYICGRFSNSLQLGNIQLTTNGFGSSYRAFIAKLDATTHQVIWATSIPARHFPVIVTDLAPDDMGNLFISGNLSGDIDTALFDTDTITVGGTEAFAAKVDSQGKFEWVKQYGGAGAARGYGIDLDDQQNAYLAGYHYNGGSSANCFLAKLDKSGNAIWERYIPTGVFDQIHVSNNSLYLTGHTSYIDSLDFGDTILNNADEFILRLDTSGNFGWMKSHQDVENSISIENLAIGRNGAIYTHGHFANTRKFGASHLVNPDFRHYYLGMLYDEGDSIQGGAIIKGVTYFDSNNDCSYDSSDFPAARFGIVATPGNFITVADTNGLFTLRVPSGNYTIQQILPEEGAGILEQTCPIGGQYPTGSVNSRVEYNGFDFGNVRQSCLYNSIELGTTDLYCYTKHNLSARVCNYSSVPIDSATLRITLPDTLILLGTTPQYSYYDTLNNELVFDLVEIPADTCFNVTIKDSFPCMIPDYYYWGLDFFYSADFSPKNSCSGLDSSLNFSTAQTGFVIPISASSQAETLQIITSPNPFTGDFSVSIQKPGLQELKLTIFDLVGQRIMSISESNPNSTYQKSFNLSTLPNGLYLLEVILNGNRIVKRIIKQ